eukprot:m.436532 g.436532  ORF g.436532 m.436532 type:complete len:195 (+) comp17988_c0_seq1:313-897(+)
MVPPGASPPPPPPRRPPGDGDDKEVRQQCYGVRGENNACMGILFVFTQSVAALRATPLPESWVRVVMINEKRDLDGRKSGTPSHNSDGSDDPNPTTPGHMNDRPPPAPSRDTIDTPRKVTTPSWPSELARDVQSTLASPAFREGMKEALKGQAQFINGVVTDVCSGKQLAQAFSFTGKLVGNTATSLIEWIRKL